MQIKCFEDLKGLESEAYFISKVKRVTCCSESYDIYIQTKSYESNYKMNTYSIEHTISELVKFGFNIA